MGFLQNIGNAVKKAAVDTGHFAGKVASNPIVDAGIGLIGGPAAAAAASGLGHILQPGGNIGAGLKGAATGYAAGSLGSGLGDAVKAGGGFGKIASHVLPMAVSSATHRAIPVTGDPNPAWGRNAAAGSTQGPDGSPSGEGNSGPEQGDDGSPDGEGNAGPGQSGRSAPGGGFDLSGTIKKYGGDLLGGLQKYGTTALEGVNVAQAAQRQAQSNQYAKDALAGTQARFDAKAPLRMAGQAGMLDPGAGAPNLSNIRQLATAGSGNPFARALPVAGVATKAPGYSPTGTLNQALPMGA